MVCIARFRNLIARSPIQHLKLSPRDLGLDHASSPHRLTLPHRRRSFRTIAAMMVDSGAATGPGTGPAVGGLHPIGCAGDGGCLSGGWRSNDGRLSCGYSSFRGRRPSMEDFYDVKTSKIDGETVNLFGVFDGHGGSRAAEYLKEHLFENLLKHSQFMTDTKTAISETYKKTDSDFLNVESNSLRDDGSTASTTVLIGRHLYVANVGDSRAVMSKAGKAIALSNDHKPNRTDERQRIENAGGVIAWAGTWRVGGVLAMSRAFGNRLLKRYVVAEPEIQELGTRKMIGIGHERNKLFKLELASDQEQYVDDDLEFLVLASDGLWDVVPNEDAVSIASMEEEPEAAALKLLETAFSRGSTDNITCIVVRFHHDSMEIDSP